MSSRVQRKLTTILAADAEGYSRAMDKDEESAFDALRTARVVFSRFIERHHGRIVNTAGDGLIAEFPSVVEAVQCAIEIQNELGSHSRVRKDALRFRIGIHLGDVMVDGSDLLGEGVNLAARLEAMAEPGGVMISQQVYDQVQHKLSVRFDYLGEKRPKNFAEDVSVYQLSVGEKPRNSARAERKTQSRLKRASTNTVDDNQRERVFHHAKLLCALWFVLVGVDVATGAPFWAHWPGIAIGTLVALKAAPMFVSGWFNISFARVTVIVGALALVNLFTWSGYPWVIWPAGALISIELIRQLVTGSR